MSRWRRTTSSATRSPAAVSVTSRYRACTTSPSSPSLRTIPDAEDGVTASCPAKAVVVTAGPPDSPSLYTVLT